MIRYIYICLMFPFILFAQETQLGKGVHYLSFYISSEDFRQMRNKTDDISLVDSIYIKALDYTKGDIAEALRILTFTTVPYNKVPVIIPFFRIHLTIPLVSVKDSVFLIKNENLPSQLFPDSPKNAYGDRDKLAHFFGSAYIAYISRIFDFTRIIGYFVEDFEESFYIDSKADTRDIRADELGELFGKELKNNKSLLPSEVFTHLP